MYFFFGFGTRKSYILARDDVTVTIKSEPEGGVALERSHFIRIAACGGTGAKLPVRIITKYCIVIWVFDVITHGNFSDHRSEVNGIAGEGSKFSPFH